MYQHGKVDSTQTIMNRGNITPNFFPEAINDLSEIIQIPELLSKIEREFYYFNKPKSSMFVADKVSNLPTLTFAILLQKSTEISSMFVSEPHKILLIGSKTALTCSSDLIESKNDILNFIQENQVKTAYFLYINGNNSEYSNKYYQNNIQLNKFKSDKIEVFFDILKKRFDKISPLLTCLHVGQYVGKLNIGNCGELCVYAASEFLKKYYHNEKDILNIEVIQASFILNGKINFSHVFLVVNNKKPFSPSNINDATENSYIVDPWNFSYTKISEFKKENLNLSYLKFFIENYRSFDWKTDFSTIDINSNHYSDVISNIFSSKMENFQDTAVLTMKEEIERFTQKFTACPSQASVNSADIMKLDNANKEVFPQNNIDMLQLTDNNIEAQVNSVFEIQNHQETKRIAHTLGNSLSKGIGTNTPQKKISKQLQKVLSCFQDIGEDLPTPELALRRASRGETPKRNTGLSKHINIVEYLTENVTDINASASTGMTALHLAVAAGLAENVRILVDAGAKFDIPDKSSDKKTAYAYAQMEGKEKILEIFNKKIAHTI